MEEQNTQNNREKDLKDLASLFKKELSILGEVVDREGLLKTPMRVAKSMLDLTRGYTMNPLAVLQSAKFKEEYRQMVIVKDIDFFSLCEHHILPFYGKAHIAYIPNGYITGLSKIVRVVDIFSHRLQVQERMTTQIKECIQEALNPLGVMVVLAGVMANPKAFFPDEPNTSGFSANTRSCEVSTVLTAMSFASMSPIAETAPELMSTR